jgi:hypothetical protein
MTEWSKDHVAAIGSLTQHFGSVSKAWLKWRPGATTMGKGRQLVGKVREWICGKSTPPRL